MKITHVLLSLLLLLCSCVTCAASVTIDDHFKSSKVTNLHYSFKPTSLKEATTLDLEHWQLITNKPLNLGLEKKPVWISFNIENTTSVRLTSLLSIDNPLLDEVSVFHLSDEVILKKQFSHILPISQPSLKSDALLIKLTLNAHSSTTVLVKVANSSGLNVPMTLWQQDAYLVHQNSLNLLYGLLIGFIGALGFSCLLLYGFSKKEYFALTGSIIVAFGLLLLYLSGFGFRYLDSFVSQQNMISVLLVLITILLWPLQKKICELNKTKAVSLLNITMKLFVVSSLTIWLLPNWVSTLCYLLTIPIILVIQMLIMFLGIQAHPSTPKKVLLAATCCVFIVTSYLVIVVFGWYTMAINSLFSLYILLFGSTFCLCFTAIKKFILERDEQVMSQQTLIAESAAQDTVLKERLALQEKAHKELEAQVDERTFELQVTLRELEEKNRELEQLNTEDALTGVKNRRFFDKKLVMELRRSRREQTPLSIIMLDIDHFKAINDTHGHIAGDQVIKFVANIIKNCLKRPLDEVARYGGEEFVVLLPNTPAHGAFEIAKQIRQQVEQSTVTIAGSEITFTISAGIYTNIADDINNAEIFTKHADKALYSAKQNGRNQVIHF